MSSLLLSACISPALYSLLERHVLPSLDPRLPLLSDPHLQKQVLPHLKFQLKLLPVPIESASGPVPPEAGATTPAVPIKSATGLRPPVDQATRPRPRPKNEEQVNEKVSSTTTTID